MPFVVSIRRMKCTFRILRVLLVTFTVAIVSVALMHLALRPNPDIADAEQYAVLSAYLDHGLSRDSHGLGGQEGVVLIAARTKFSQSIPNSNKFEQYRSLVMSTNHAKARFQPLSRLLMFEFWAANISDVTLEPKFHLSAQYELATENDMNLYPSAAFYKRYPRSYGALTFTRVAFNHDVTKAFFYTEHLCGLCGEGKFVYMQKTGRKWVVAATALTWIS